MDDFSKLELERIFLFTFPQTYPALKKSIL